MSKLKKCIYIVHLLKTHDKMTQKEISQQLQKEFAGDSPLSERTFARYKDFIEETFPCKIVFDNSSKTYSLYNRSTTYKEDEQIFNYLFYMYNVQLSASLLMKHSNLIHNIDIVTGTDNLNIVLRAIDEHRGMQCDYRSFNNATTKRRTLIPMFLSTWEGRWYVIAEVTTHPGSPVVYCLERMSDIVLTEEQMHPSVNITMDEYFRDNYGIQHANADDRPLDIILRATDSKVEYLRARPIHPSQQEITEQYTNQKLGAAGSPPRGERGEGSLFALHLVPCYNFYQQLLYHREGIEVLEPQEVKNELKNILQKINEIYK